MAEPVTPKKAPGDVVSALTNLGLTDIPGFVTPTREAGEGNTWEEEQSASPLLLGLTEDNDLSAGLERLMLWEDNLTGALSLKSYRQILTYDFAGRIVSPSEQYLSPLDRSLLNQLKGSSRFVGLPVGCIRTSDGHGSTFAVSQYLKTVSQLNLTAQDPERYQWQLSAAHNTNRSKELVNPGVWSDSLMSGVHISFQSGMPYQIVVHGEEDRDRYNLVDKVVRSPPASPDKAGKGTQADRYRDPSKGKVFGLHTDAQLILVKVNPTLACSHEKRFFVPSGSRPDELDSMEPIYIAGTPGRVRAEDVPICLGRPVPDGKYALADAINRHMLAPNIRGISFGHKVVTNGRQDKHSASTWRGLSGAPEGNMEYEGCFEGVHVSGTPQLQEYVYNRAVSKDDPFLACMYVDYVLPDLHGFREWQYPGQEPSLRTWLQNHKQLLQEKNLWGKVEASGFA